MSDCVFCDILSGRLPSSMIYRDDLCCALVDIQPVNSGHVLVIPIRHAKDLADLDGETGAHMFRIAQRVAAAIRASDIPGEGINLFLADGEVAGQEVFHVHLHVIPRYEGDGFGLKLGPEYGNRPSRAELDDIAGRIRQML
jgi:histidine triad (HIT) family protein